VSLRTQFEGMVRSMWTRLMVAAAVLPSRIANVVMG